MRGATLANGGGLYSWPETVPALKALPLSLLYGQGRAEWECRHRKADRVGARPKQLPLRHKGGGFFTYFLPASTFRAAGPLYPAEGVLDGAERFVLAATVPSCPTKGIR